MKSAPLPHPTPMQLLGSGPWTHAFFTTYALSLTFFEAVVLRELRAVGCGEVWVFVDAHGYRTSLTERRAYRVGQEYRIIPIALPKGVFHPKCTFLSAAGESLLLVGSGNLTFGGYGRNLEVMEAARTSTHPRLFKEFSDFLRSLADRNDIQIGDRGGLRLLADMASTATQANTAQVEGLRLVHSADRPIIDALEESAKSLGRCKRVTALSPYFDKSGSAVKSLAQRLGTAHIRVALPADPKGACAFPFASARDWPYRVAAARADLGEERRFSHAKWLEAEFEKGRLTLTGSVNATWPALCSTDNIEVGILRQTKGANSWIRWVSADIPQAVEVPPIEPDDANKRGVLFAQLEADGRLEGCVIGRADAVGEWQATLVDQEAESATFMVAVDSTARFQFAVPDAERFAFATALQLTLERGNTSLRGWVHLEDLLRMPKLRRLGITSLHRLANRRETGDDDAALLDYLALSASRHFDVFGRRLSAIGGSTGHGAAKRDETHRVSGIAPDPRSFGTDAGDPAFANSPEGRLERMFGALRRRMVLGSPSPGTGLSDGGDDDPGEADIDRDRDRKKLPKRQRLLESGLERFDAAMRRALQSAADEKQDKDQRALLVIWFEVTVHMLLNRLRRPDAAKDFTREWLNYVLACNTKAASALGSLEHYVALCSALQSCRAAPEDRELLRGQLRERLDAFFAGETPFDSLRALISSEPEMTLLSVFASGTVSEPLAELDAIAGTITIRQQLYEIYQAYVAGRSLPRNLPVLQSGVGALLLNAMSASKRRVVTAVHHHDQGTSCAHCDLSLQSHQKYQLERLRVTQCIECKKFTIQLAP